MIIKQIKTYKSLMIQLLDFKFITSIHLILINDDLLDEFLPFLNLYLAIS
jgi:hypothetical protein